MILDLTKIFNLEKSSIRIDSHWGEITTCIRKLNLGFGETGLSIWSLHHWDWGFDDNLLPTPTTVLGGGTLLLDVHHAPHDEDEDE